MNRLYYLLLLFIFPIFSNINAQNQIQECGTVLTPEQEEYLDKTRIIRQNYLANKSGQKSINYVPVQHHIIRRSDGSGGLPAYEIQLIMDELNHHYAPVNMVFFECGPVNEINDDTYYDFTSSQEAAFCGTHDVQDVVNVYYFNSLKSGSTPVCGYSRFPPSVDRVMMDESCANDGGGTMTHEFGHYFSLYHTHGKTNFGTTTELVNGSNCATAGDDLCDTPADPNVYTLVNSNCYYTGTAVDANGQSYNPPTDNIMSYSTHSCRDKLTSDQLNRAVTSLAIDRSYLTCASPSAPKADFLVSTIESCDGVVQFFDHSSSKPSNWLWKFGDGQNSTQKNPSHVYSASGTYDVTLISSNSNGGDTITKNAVVNVTLPAGPTINPVDSICEGETAFLQAAGGKIVNWYDNVASTTPVSTGNSIVTSPIFQTTTYFASNPVVVPNMYVGAIDTSIGSTMNFNTRLHLVFDAFKPFKLKKVKVFSTANGLRTIELRNSRGFILQDTTIFISSGERFAYLNFDVPAGKDLELGLSATSQVDFKGNTNGGAYPYKINKVVEITGSSSSTHSYFFFYSWEIEQKNCESKRNPITIGVKDCFVGMQDLKGLHDIKMMPNPSNGELFISNDHFDALEIRIVDVMGAEVYRNSLPAGKSKISLTGLQKGLYLVNYVHGDSKVVRKLVLE